LHHRDLDLLARIGTSIDDSTTTETSTQTPSIELRIRGPRSQFVNTILLLLYRRPMRSAELAKILGKPSRYVSSYLSYWKSRGLVTYRAGYWMLTKLGEEYVRMLMSMETNTLGEEVGTFTHRRTSEQVRQTINGYGSQGRADERPGIQPFTAGQIGSLWDERNTEHRIERALKCLDHVLGNKDLLEEEMYVLKYLVKHYVEWGSTYTYLDQLAEDLHYDTRTLLSTLRKLQTKKLIYIFADRRFGYRIGLSKPLKQLIDACTASR